jgi:hypothetical protein
VNDVVRRAAGVPTMTYPGTDPDCGTVLV